MIFESGFLLAERYLLQKRSGRTAIGRQTWLAIDKLTGEATIVKLLAFNPQMDWEELKLFEREARVLASLHHPRIPRYRDYLSIDKNQGDGVPWFVLIQDYIDGESLGELLENNRRFTLAEVKNIAVQILEILIYLHSLNPPALHRDIKPSNILLNADNELYLVDFGAVQSQASVTGVTFTVVGTSGYAPIEQFWGRAVPGSDLYALGATLIHLLTGVNPIDLPLKDSRVQFRQLVSADEDFILWLEKMTEPALEKRFTTATEALKYLQSPRSLRKSRERRLGIDKPKYSNVRLERSADDLKIYIPPRFSLLLNTTHPIAILCTLILSLFINPILFAIAVVLTFVCFKNTYLEFHPDRVLIRYKLLDIIYRKITLDPAEILGIFLQNNRGGSRYQIRIRSRQQNCTIGDNLTEDECLWLGQEMQNWLTNINDDR